MSVITEADEHLDSAKEHVKLALQDLSKILIDGCLGHDEYKLSYKDKMREAMIDLMKVQDMLR